MPALASTLHVVAANINRFAYEVRRNPALANRLAYFRAWYAEQGEDGRWRFGPSKFVGYEGLDGETYLELSTRHCLDGRITEPHVQQWFMEINTSAELYELLSAKLSAYLAQYGKSPNGRMRINIAKS